MISRLKELFSEKNESAKKGFLKKGFSKSGFQKKEFHKREGSSLISVIIGVVFLSAIGLTVLTVSTRYAVTTIVDRNSADNFYQTEGILEEIRTGLLEKAGDASEKAYTEILENYTSEKGSMKEKYAKEYLSGFVSALMNDGITYDPKNIDDNLGKLQTCSDKTLDLLKSMTRVSDAVKAKENILPVECSDILSAGNRDGYRFTDIGSGKGLFAIWIFEFLF